MWMLLITFMSALLEGIQDRITDLPSFKTEKSNHLQTQTKVSWGMAILSSSAPWEQKQVYKLAVCPRLVNW